MTSCVVCGKIYNRSIWFIVTIPRRDPEHRYAYYKVSYRYQRGDCILRRSADSALLSIRMSLVLQCCRGKSRTKDSSWWLYSTAFLYTSLFLASVRINNISSLFWDMGYYSKATQFITYILISYVIKLHNILYVYSRITAAVMEPQHVFNSIVAEWISVLNKKIEWMIQWLPRKLYETLEWIIQTTYP